MSAWLSVIGLGLRGRSELAPAAAEALDRAEAVFAAPRHLDLVRPIAGDEVPWPARFDDGLAAVAARRGRATAVLASGDPTHYGIATSLARNVPPGEMAVYPGPSSLSLAAARLGWGLQHSDVVSLHGRPLGALGPALAPGRRLLLLTDRRSRPATIAAFLTSRGWGASTLTAMAELGGETETHVTARADEWPGDGGLSALVTVAIVCAPAPQTPAWTWVPGLPEDAFEHDGKITKRAVRAITLAKLAPSPGAHLWDIGCGNGAVAVEWLRAAASTRVTAIEPKRQRLHTARANLERLAGSGWELVEDRAPTALAGLAPPDAIFIGGGLSESGMLEAAWAALPAGGRLVANAVTLEGEERLLGARHELPGASLQRLGSATAEPVGTLTGWQAAMTVTQLAATKP